MKKLPAVLLLLLFLTACAAPAQPAAESAFIDDIGREVFAPQQPHNVAILFSSYAQIWQLAGGNVSITVGESIERGFASADAVLVDAGAGKTIDHELLLAAQPDLVIGSADIKAHQEACRILDEAGIPCALFRVDTFEDYLRMLKICTDLTQTPSAYETHGELVAAEIRDLKDRLAQAQVAAKDILFIRAGSQPSAVKAKRAPDNFVCTMLDELGAHNIADEAPILLDGLSLEEILLQDPDHIFLSSMGSEDASKAYMEDLFRQDGWKDLRAVQAGNYTFLDKELFHYKPNNRWAEAYALLAQLLYPELDLT